MNKGFFVYRHNYKRKMETSTSLLEKEYLESLSPKEMDSYAIAKSILGSSFSLTKSCGFIAWCKKMQHSKEEQGKSEK